MIHPAPPGNGLPPALLHAVSEAKGKVVLVLGAGCSFPPPTSVPMAKRCSHDAHRSLLRDHVLADGDCPNPDDLSVLADTVFEKCNGHQAELVNRLPLDAFRRAAANRGYLIAAALLRENAISSILTLNYDLGMESALTQLSAREVQKIARPEDMRHFALHNVVYLHRNVDEVDPEKWVLRASALASDWKGGWEGMMAQVMMTSPVVVFAGLGSPAAVLVETAQRIKACLGGLDVFQADPQPAAGNAFFAALGIPPAAFIQLGWNEFMLSLGHRVAMEQLDHLAAVCAAEIKTELFAVPNADSAVEYLRSMDLVELGKMRAEWLTLEEQYTPYSPLIAGFMAHLLIASTALLHATSAHELVVRHAVVEFRSRSGEVLTSVMMASGKGVRGWTAIEEELRRQRALIPRQDAQPSFAIVVAATGRRPFDVAAPSSIVLDERPKGDILAGEAPLALLDAHDVCTNPAMLATVI